MQPELKLHDKLTGLKLSATPVAGADKISLSYSFAAPCPIPSAMVPQNPFDTRAHVRAFDKINQYLKSRIVLLD